MYAFDPKFPVEFVAFDPKIFGQPYSTATAYIKLLILSQWFLPAAKRHGQAELLVEKKKKKKRDFKLFWSL